MRQFIRNTFGMLGIILASHVVAFAGLVWHTLYLGLLGQPAITFLSYLVAWELAAVLLALSFANLTKKILFALSILSVMVSAWLVGHTFAHHARSEEHTSELQ